MSEAAQILALVAAATNALAGAWGAWRWWRVEPSRLFWVLARAGQAAAWAFALGAVVLYVSGARPDDALFWLYAFLPVLVGVFGEQIRLLAAQTVLAARGLPDAQAMRALPEGEQRSVVLAIVRRELGVMTVSALVVAFLALRALQIAGGI